MDRHLSPTETARRFGVSIKALRLYEQRGLLTPLRSEAGWRTYGPDQIGRLHQVLTLKGLGLPLAHIAQLLAGRDELDAVLALHEQVLARQSQSVTRALVLLRAARAKLATGAGLSIDDLTDLTKETVMTIAPDVKEMGLLLKPFAERHLSEGERAAMKAKVTDRDQTIRDWNGLIAQARALMEADDPASPAAQDLARRWTEMNKRVGGDDPDIRAKARAMWNEAMEDPSVAERLALNRDVFAFVNRAIEHLKAQAK
jgi:DNA-binding transcriptional MerR regulator